MGHRIIVSNKVMNKWMPYLATVQASSRKEAYKKIKHACLNGPGAGWTALIALKIAGQKVRCGK
tara:strand:+ start:415 stop:606 length:192 start_codon:yes stop_codon:yes gene_type:complete